MHRAIRISRHTYLVILSSQQLGQTDWRFYDVREAAARVINLTYRNALLIDKYIYKNLQPNKRVNVPLLSAQIVTRIQNGCILTTRTPVKHHHHAARFRFVSKKIYVYIYFFNIFCSLFYWMLL